MGQREYFLLIKYYIYIFIFSYVNLRAIMDKNIHIGGIKITKKVILASQTTKYMLHWWYHI